MAGRGTCPACRILFDSQSIQDRISVSEFWGLKVARTEHGVAPFSVESALQGYTFRPRYNRQHGRKDGLREFEDVSRL